MHGNQLIKLAFIDNYSWKKLSLNWIEEVARLQQEEYMRENCRGKKYFLTNLDILRKNGSVTKIWLCKVMSEKRGWQVTKSPPLYPPSVCGHYFFSAEISNSTFFYLLIWDTSFWSFCVLFDFCLYIIIVYVSTVWPSMILFSLHEKYFYLWKHKNSLM